jgi:hypothetical protein
MARVHEFNALQRMRKARKVLYYNQNGIPSQSIHPKEISINNDYKEIAQ